MEVVRPLDPTRTEYVYGRIKVPARIAKRFMDSGNGSSFRINEDEETAEAIVYAYTQSRAEAEEFARDIFQLGVELQELGRNLQDFVKNHKSDKWKEDDGSSNSVV